MAGAARDIFELVEYAEGDLSAKKRTFTNAILHPSFLSFSVVQPDRSTFDLNLGEGVNSVSYLCTFHIYWVCYRGRRFHELATVEHPGGNFTQPKSTRHMIEVITRKVDKERTFPRRSP